MKYVQKYWILIVIVFFFSMFINPAISMLIVGSLVFFLGISAFLFLKKIQDKGIEGVGRILSYQNGNKGYKTPIIEFTPLNGETVTAKPWVYASTDLSKIRSYSNKIDSEVLVRYDPEDPTKFVLESEKSFNYIAFTIFTLAGLFFIVLSICNFLGYIKLGRQ
ncbi:DUF3592 domain-containing protein [Flavisolibacter ginsengisoli]|jgi:hypothetical protein|nr:DUF3592 domain-containing protein [Flavisolibacter ginsengisoli]